MGPSNQPGGVIALSSKYGFLPQRISYPPSDKSSRMGLLFYAKQYTECLQNMFVGLEF